MNVESKDVPSGDALQMVFQQLNAKLAAKAMALEETERRVLALWARWQGLSGDEELSIRRPRQFDVLSLAKSLENLLQAKALVTGSPEFQRQIAKFVVRQTMPDLAAPLLDQIDAEIEQASAEPPSAENVGAGTTPRPPDGATSP